jgi:UDP-N-acetylglucosamine--dolichyl-phosphate N-acetylglucosaminephosphotransferase
MIRISNTLKPSIRVQQMIDVFALIYLESFLISLTACLLILPPYIRKAKAVGIIGLDIHKLGSPAVAECGGVILILAYLLGLFFFVPFTNPTLKVEIIGTAATVLLASFIGFIDDIYETRWRIKVLTPLLGGVPLAILSLGRTRILTPFGLLDFAAFGLVGLVFFYALVLPFAVTASANAVNMFAGLNGQEAGSSAIMTLALLFLSLRWGKPEGYIILIPFVGALLAFLAFNKYPSKVFPGDIGTFGMGAVIACVAILADLERAAVIMFIPHSINAALFFIGVLKRKSPPRSAQMNPDGTLPAPSIWSLRSVLLRIHPMNEKTLVYTILLIVAAFSIIGMLAYGL